MVGNQKVSAHVDHFIGFSLANFSRTWYQVGQSAGLRAAYSYYLAHPESSLNRRSPPVSGLSASVVASSLDVSVQWNPISAMPSPAAGVAPTPVLGYVIYRNGVQLTQVEQRFTSRLGADGFYSLETSGPATFIDPSVPTDGRLRTKWRRSTRTEMSLRAPRWMSVPVRGCGCALLERAPADRGCPPDFRQRSLQCGWPRCRSRQCLERRRSRGVQRDVRRRASGQQGGRRPWVAARYEDPAWTGPGTGDPTATERRSGRRDRSSGEVAVHGVRTHWLSDRKVAVARPCPSAVTVTTRNQQSDLDGCGVRAFECGFRCLERRQSRWLGSRGRHPESRHWLVHRCPARRRHEEIATTVRVTVEGAADAFAFLSEVQVLTAVGANVCAEGACTARVLTRGGGECTDQRLHSSIGANSHQPEGAPDDGRYAHLHDLPVGCGRAVRGLEPLTPFDLVVDLGVDQPVGKIASDWFNTNGGALAPKVSAFVLSDSTASSAPDLTANAPWVAVAAARTDSGNDRPLHREPRGGGRASRRGAGSSWS